MPKFTFDERSQRYRLKKTGRYISPIAVRRILDADIDVRQKRMQDVARQLQRGEITVETYKQTMMQEVKNLHLVEVAMARGGADRMRQSDYGRAGQKIRFHYEKLQGLIADIEADPEFIHGVEGRMDFVTRSGMYAEAGIDTYESARLIEMRGAGFRYRENVLEPSAHHCVGRGSCLEMQQLGRVTIDDNRFIPPGQRKCIVRCRCNVRYFRSRGQVA